MKQYDIYQRCEDYTVHVIELIESIPYRKSVGIIGDQLIRSSGSVGANLNEASNARTKREFISCIGISLKEIMEAQYWLRVLSRTNHKYKHHISEVQKEAESIMRILAKIYWNSKKSSQSDIRH